MAVTTDQLVVKVQVDGKTAKAQIDDLTGSMNKNVKAQQSMLDTFTKLNLGFFALTENISNVIGALEGVVKPFMESADNALRLQATLSTMADKDLDKFSKKIEELGDKVENFGLAGADQVKTLAVWAKQSGVTTEQIELMTEAAAGLAAIKPDVSFEQAFKALEDSLKGNTSGLAVFSKRLGDMRVEAAKSGVHLQALADKFGPQANKNLQTYAGAMTYFQSSVGKVVEQAGRLVAEGTGLITVLTSVGDGAKAVAEYMKSMINGLQAVDWKLMAINIGLVTAAVVGLGLAFDKMALSVVIANFKALGMAISAAALPALKFAAVVAGIVAVGAAVDVLMKNFRALGEIVVDSLKIALDGIILFANRAIAVFFKMIGDVSSVFGSVTKQITDATKKNLASLDKSYAESSGNIDKSLERMRENFAGLDVSAFEKLNKVLTGTFSVSKDVEGSAKDATDAIVTLGQKGEQAAKKLQIMLEQLRKESATAGLQGIAAITAEFQEAGRAADELMKTIKAWASSAAIDPKIMAQYGEIKRLLGEAYDRKVIEAFSKASDDMLKATIDSHNAYNNALGTTEDKINGMLAGQLRIIEAKRQELEIQGLLTGEMEDMLRLQESNAKAVAASAKRSMTRGGSFETSARAASEAFSGVMTQATSGLAGAATGYLAAADAIADAVQAIIDFLPNFINKIAGIFNSLTDLPGKLTEAVGNLFSSVGNYIRNINANMFKMIGDIPDMLADFLLDLPDAFLEGAIKMFDQIDKLVERAPEIVEKLVQGILAATPNIAINFVNVLIQNAPRIAWKMMEVFMIELPKAFWKGVAEALKSIFSNLGKLLTGKLPKIQVDEKSLKNVVKNLTGLNSDMFKVSDMTDKIKGPVEDITNSVAKTFKDGAKAFKDIFKWVEDKIIKPLGELFSKLWSGLTNVLGDLWDGLSSIGGKLWEGIKQAFSGLGKLFQDAFDLLNPFSVFKKFASLFQQAFDILNPENLFKKIFNISGSSGQGTVEQALRIDVPFLNFARGGMVPGSASVPGDSLINDKILAMLSPGEAIVPRSVMQDPVMGALIKQIIDGGIPQFAFGGSIGKAIGGAVGGLTKGISNAFKGVTDILGALGSGALSMFQKALLEPLMDIVKDQVIYKLLNAMFEQNKFAAGGLVTGGVSGKDSVPSLLMPGEFVMNKTGVQTAGLNNLRGMNAGRSASSGSTVQNITVNLEINSSGNIDASFVKNKIMPVLRDELRRASLDGKNVISSRGVR